MRALFRWVRGLFELAGAVTLLLSAGVGTAVAAIATALLVMPWPYNVLAFAGIGMIGSAGILAGSQHVRRRRLPDLDAAARSGSYAITITGRKRYFPHGNPALRSETDYGARRARRGDTAALAEQIDGLLREGAALMRELPEAAPVVSAESGYRVPLLPDPVHGERVSEFDERTRALLLARRPSLLPIYAKTANARWRRWRERNAADDQPDDVDVDNATRIKAFADASHQRPSVCLGAYLEGLSAARNRLGH